VETVLITGGAGFIGSHLVDRLLELEKKVICIDNFDPFYDEKIKLRNIENALLNPNFKFCKADIRDKLLLDSCFKDSSIDLVIHLAAKAGVRPSIESPFDYYSVNVDGTLNLLETMKNNSIDKMIFASSSSVYGNNTKAPFSEADNVDYPISPYAASKKTGELLCYTYHHLYNFDITCLRFFTVYGPRQRPDLAIHKFTKSILEGRLIPFFGDGTTERDYTYIDDIIDGILLVMAKLNGYDIVNLGEARKISLTKMVNTLEHSLKINAVIEKQTAQPGDVKLTHADITKAKAKYGYNPKWDFEKGIQEFINWLKTELSYS
jgi:Nucleoside-diphosphate-sugar epimerases